MRWLVQPSVFYLTLASPSKLCTYPPPNHICMINNVSLSLHESLFLSFNGNITVLASKIECEVMHRSIAVSFEALGGSMRVENSSILGCLSVRMTAIVDVVVVSSEVQFGMQLFLGRAKSVVLWNSTVSQSVDPLFLAAMSKGLSILGNSISLETSRVSSVDFPVTFEAEDGHLSILSSVVRAGPPHACLMEHHMFKGEDRDFCTKISNERQEMTSRLLAKHGKIMINVSSRIQVAQLLSCSLDFLLDASSSLSGRGCARSEGPGHGHSGWKDECGAGGGGHVGEGGDGCWRSGGRAYDGELWLTDISNVPVSSGSGGGGDYGGGGGGLLWISGSSLEVNGMVMGVGEDAAEDSPGSGGGAGGSIILISTGQIDGEGILNVSGGGGSGAGKLKGGTGGGGFIAIEFSRERAFGQVIMDVGFHGIAGQLSPCLQGRSGPLCLPCPEGYWNSDGLIDCYKCKNIPKSANFSGKGATSPNCPYVCPAGYPDVLQNPECLDPLHYFMSFFGGSLGLLGVVVGIFVTCVGSLVISEMKKQPALSRIPSNDRGEASLEFAIEDVPHLYRRIYISGKNSVRHPWMVPEIFPESTGVGRKKWETFREEFNRESLREPWEGCLWARPVLALLRVFWLPLYECMEIRWKLKRASHCLRVLERHQRQLGSRRGMQVKFSMFDSVIALNFLSPQLLIENWSGCPELPLLLRLCGEGTYMNPFAIWLSDPLVHSFCFAQGGSFSVVMMFAFKHINVLLAQLSPEDILACSPLVNVRLDQIASRFFPANLLVELYMLSETFFVPSGGPRSAQYQSFKDFASTPEAHSPSQLSPVIILSQREGDVPLPKTVQFLASSHNPSIEPLSNMPLSCRVWHYLMFPIHAALKHRQDITVFERTFMVASRAAILSGLVPLFFLYCMLLIIHFSWYLALSPLCFTIVLLSPPACDIFAIALGFLWIGLSISDGAKWFALHLVASLLPLLLGCLVRMLNFSGGFTMLNFFALLLEYVFAGSLRIFGCILSNMLFAQAQLTQDWGAFQLWEGGTSSFLATQTR